MSCVLLTITINHYSLVHICVTKVCNMFAQVGKRRGSIFVPRLIFRRQPRGFWHAIYLLNVVVGHGTRAVFVYVPPHSFVAAHTGDSFYESTSGGFEVAEIGCSHISVLQFKIKSSWESEISLLPSRFLDANESRSITNGQKLMSREMIDRCRSGMRFG